MRLIILFVLLALIPAQAGAWWVIQSGEEQQAPPASTCSATPYYSETTQSNTLNHSDLSSRAYVGAVYGGSNVSLCQLDVYVHLVTGTPTGNYSIQVWSTSGNDLDTLVGESDVIAGASITTGLNSFTFSTPASLTAGSTAVVLATTGGVDSSNYVVLAYQATGADEVSFPEAYYDNTGVRIATLARAWRVTAYADQ